MWRLAQILKSRLYNKLFLRSHFLVHFYNSKMVITGDESQIDLKPLVKSGIVVACDILKNIDDIAFMHFNVDDVVRNPLVSKIILAYDKLNDEKR